MGKKKRNHDAVAASLNEEIFFDQVLSAAGYPNVPDRLVRKIARPALLHLRKNPASAETVIQETGDELLKIAVEREMRRGY